MIDALAARFLDVLVALVEDPHRQIVALDQTLHRDAQSRRAYAGTSLADEAEQFNF